MQYIKLVLKLFLRIIFRKFKFGQDTPVMAGLDCIVKADGKIVAYATGVTMDEDFELQGIRTLGFHGDRK